MRVELEALARKQEPLLRNLCQFYVYDFSEFMGWDVTGDGRFTEDDVNGRWDSPDRHQYLIYANEQPAGFVLVDLLGQSSVTLRGPVVEMREFFVMRAYRRRGVGRQAAVRAFDLFRGVWEVYELQQNVAAQAFWRRVIGQYTAGRYEEQPWKRFGYAGVMQSFDNSSSVVGRA